MERQSCSRERVLKLTLAQRNNGNKGMAVLSLIRGGMRCRQQSPKRDDFISQTVKKTHTLSFEVTVASLALMDDHFLKKNLVLRPPPAKNCAHSKHLNGL